MAHTIEPAKSGRAACRACKQKIEKGALRLGVEAPTPFGDAPSLQWYHLACGAEKKPRELSDALAAYEGDVPEREALLARAAEGARKAKPTTFPYAERASTGRSSCLKCEAAIEKGTLRVAVEREVDTGAFMRKGPGYLHPGCAGAFTGDGELLAKVRRNSPGLTPAEQDELGRALAGS